MHDDRVPVGTVDITAAAFSLDPAPGLAELRKHAPISWQPGVRGFLLTRFPDVEEAYRNPLLVELDLAKAWRKISRKLRTNYDSVLRIFDHLPFVYEGRRHRELRTSLALGIAQYSGAEQIFSARIKRLLLGAKRDGGFDLSGDFARTLLFEIISDLIELPEDSRSEIRPVGNLSWGLDPILSAKNRTILNDILARTLPPLRDHVGKVLERSGPSLIHHIRDSLPADDGDKVETTATLLAVILVMGNDAVGGCITYPVWALLRDAGGIPQERWAEIADDAIRFASPVTYSTRVASKDTTVGGCPFRRNEIVMMSPLAANHDPAAFGPEPNSLTPKSRRGVGLAFGAGAHACIGMRISRNILKAAFEALASLPPMKLAGPVTQGRGRAIRTVESLPVQFE